MEVHSSESKSNATAVAGSTTTGTGEATKQKENENGNGATTAVVAANSTVDDSKGKRTAACFPCILIRNTLLVSRACIRRFLPSQITRKRLEISGSLGISDF